MDFEIETVSDALPLLLIMNEQLDMNFEALSMDLDTIKQSILDDIKIIIKGDRDIFVKYIPKINSLTLH